MGYRLKCSKFNFDWDSAERELTAVSQAPGREKEEGSGTTKQQRKAINGWGSCCPT